MEYGLGLCDLFVYDKSLPVLILVVMEYGLGLTIYVSSDLITIRLNPCCNGIWSRTTGIIYYTLEGDKS